MFKHILCPVDFSDASNHAHEFALALARNQHADVTELHVEDGPIAAEILKKASTMPADVIVMGTHGAGGFEHLMLGSVAEKVLRKATCPVFTVPPQAEIADAPFKTLVCAVDFSEWSFAALEEACAIAQESSGVVIAVHVIEWPWTGRGAVTDIQGIPSEQARALCEYRRYQESLAQSRLDTAVHEIGRDRCRVEAKIAHGKAYSEVLCAAERQRADLVVLGVHGRNPLDVFFFGSTTHHVVRRAQCPVLTLRH
jgi:nucleotide-binding universal stress UspA family protein